MKKTVTFFAAAALAALALCAIAACGKAGEDAAITELAVVAQPTSLAYAEGSALSLNGLVVKAVFSDGTEKGSIAFADFGEYGITASPAHGTALSIAEHNGKQVTLKGGSATAYTNSLLVSPEGAATVTFNGNGGTFSGQETVTMDGAAGSPFADALPVPTRPGFTFTEYNTLANGSGNVFAQGTNVWTVTVYALWAREDPVADIAGLIFRHSFENASSGATTVAPVFPRSPDVTLNATAKGSYGSLPAFGSRTINETAYGFYRSGQPRNMNAADVTYLDLGEGVGTLLKNTPAGAGGVGNTFTIAFFMRLPESYDFSIGGGGQGQMIMSFASSNEMTDVFGQGFWMTVANNGSDGGMQMLWTNAGWQGAGGGRWTNNSNNAWDTTKGKWIHIAYGRDGSSSRAFINGIQADGGNFDVHFRDMSLIFNTLAGSPMPGNRNLANALFTDFRVYDRHLGWGDSSSDMQRLANSILADLNASSVADWHTAP